MRVINLRCGASIPVDYPLFFKIQSGPLGSCFRVNLTRLNPESFRELSPVMRRTATKRVKNPGQVF